MRPKIGGVSVVRCLSWKFGFKRSFAATCHKRQIDRRYSFLFEFTQLLKNVSNLFCLHVVKFFSSFVSIYLSFAMNKDFHLLHLKADTGIPRNYTAYCYTITTTPSLIISL